MRAAATGAPTPYPTLPKGEDMEMADVRADLLAYNAIMTAHAHGGHWCAYPLPYPVFDVKIRGGQR